MHGMTSGSPLDTDSETCLVQWFVMRDLTRSNAKLPAYLLLAGEGIECFTPMVPKLRICQGKRERVEAPFIHDLLFVHSSREVLDPFVERRYYRPDEITSDMCSRKIRLIGGKLEGYEGYLLSVRGSRSKRLLVELPGLLAAAVEVEPEYPVMRLAAGPDPGDGHRSQDPADILQETPVRHPGRTQGTHRTCSQTWRTVFLPGDTHHHVPYAWHTLLFGLPHREPLAPCSALRVPVLCGRLHDALPDGRNR